MTDILWGIMGMLVILAIAVLFSKDRRKIKIRTVAIALAIQVFFAVFVLYLPWGQVALEWVSNAVQAVINQAEHGIDFVFGGLVEAGDAPFALTVLPVIIFFASLTAVLYHLKVLQFVVKIIGGGLQRLLGTSRAESLNAAANIFVGQTEAPLVVRPYIAGMTKSELFAVMVGGLSTVAGSVLVAYQAMGAELEYLIAACFMAAPGALLMAKILVPAGSFDEVDAAVVERDHPEALAVDKRKLDKDALEESLAEQLADPEAGHSAGAGQDAAGEATAGEAASRGTAEPTAQQQTIEDSAAGGSKYTKTPFRRRARAEDQAEDEDRYGTPRHASAGSTDATGGEGQPRNVIDAAARGASDGLRLAANVGAMLIAFVALIYLLNLFLGQIGGWFGYGELTIEEIFGYVFAPVMWAVGVPWEEATSAGSFLGQKVILNEFVAFADFAPQAEAFSDKSQAVITFALTGFANLSSLAILLGGLGSIAKNRRSDIAQLGLRAVLAGTLANLMSASIVGMILI